MSPAEKYGKPAEALSAETLSQARASGQALANKGVVHQDGLGTGAPAPTPAMKYGGASDALQKQLPPPSRSR
jgi:hypothetical protein